MKKDFIEQAWQTGLRWLFPRRCPGCDELTPEGALICPRCADKMRLIHEPSCMCCGRQLADEQQEYCKNCRGQHFSFLYNISLFDYNETAAHAMAGIKYRGRQEYMDYFADQALHFAMAALSRMEPELLLPVPIHPSRMRERGYNQAALLAERLGAQLDIPVLRGALRRIHKTEALKNLSPQERREALRDAFAVAQLPGGLRRVCIVDDIFTTGATMEACAAALRRAGVPEVYGFCLCARGEGEKV